MAVDELIVPSGPGLEGFTPSPAVGDEAEDGDWGTFDPFAKVRHTHTHTHSPCVALQFDAVSYGVEPAMGIAMGMVGVYCLV